MSSDERQGVIQQGVDCWIEANGIRDKRTGLLIDVSEYECFAVARACYERFVLGRPLYLTWRYKMMMPVVAEWSTTPTGTQGNILAGGDDYPNRVQIHITPEQSTGWRSPLVVIQAEMTDPVTGFESRIISEVYEISFSAIPQQ